MPLYNYKCLDCHATDQRLAGLDDATALCVKCGGLMLRLDDPFIHLWDDILPWIKEIDNHAV
jgi:putative FmdB family regulatory protein